MRWLLLWLIAAGSAVAEGERAGEFDYYVLSLSWSPTWCALEGDRRGSPQCDADSDFGWVLHGLWPQYENGWPSYCRTGHRNPSRAETAAMADIMGSGGSAWHQWNKHGRCSGLSPDDYFALAREAYAPRYPAGCAPQPENRGAHSGVGDRRGVFRSEPRIVTRRPDHHLQGRAHSGGAALP